MSTEVSSSKSMPKEIVEFFKNQGGRSLIVKGGAGCGKTTFSLQLLEELAHPERSFYLSTRVSDEALYTQFPWLREKEMHGRIIDSSRILLGVLYGDEGLPLEAPAIPEEEAMKVTAARDFLKSIKKDEMGPPQKVDRTRLGILLEQNRMPEIERIYDRIDQILPQKTMLVIDSVEGVTHKYGYEMEEFINTLQKDLVENSNTDMLLVLEKADYPHIEYLVDGVVALRRGENSYQRRVREIVLEKLRATKIEQPNYLMTLNRGRFTTFEPFLPDFSKPKKWQALMNDGFYSTGVGELDEILGGGFKKGSYNVIELGDHVSQEEAYSVIRPIMLNFIKQNMGIMAVLSGGNHPKTLRDDLVRFLDPQEFDKYVRITDYFTSKSSEPYIMAFGTTNKDDALRTYRENLAALRGPENRPILDYTGFDTLEYLRGDTIAIRELLKGVATTKISQDLGIGIIKPGLKLKQEIMNMSDTYLKIVDIDKCPCIFGIKPKTIMYGIVPDDERGSPCVSLTPIV